MDTSPSALSENVFGLFRKHGNEDYLGEKVTQLEHAVQCAMMAEKESSTTEAILGALLHDIGHLVGLDQKSDRMVTEGIYLGVQGHDRLGEAFLLHLGIPQDVACFSRGHVDAKRYLTFKKPKYYEELSAASKMTLVHQGGPMSAEEAAAFEQHPQFEALVRMRGWDERAKVEGMKIKDIDAYQTMFEDYLKRVVRQ